MVRDFSGQNLKGKSFKNQDLTGADFSHAKIQGADFTQAILAGASFRSAIAGSRKRSSILVVLLLCLCGCLLGLLGLAFADTVNTAYLTEPGPLDATVVFSLLLLFSTILFRWSLLAAILTTLSGAILGWIGSILWEAFFLHDGLLLALIGPGAISVAVIEIAIVFWAGLSALPSLYGLIAASVYCQTRRQRKYRSSHQISRKQRPSLYELVALICVLLTAAVGAPGLPGVFAKISAVIVSAFLWWMGLHIKQKILNEHPSYRGLRSASLRLATWGSTCFRKAQLANTDFLEATLNATDFTGAKFYRTCFYQTQGLAYARSDSNLLRQPKVRLLLASGVGESSYVGCDLKGAYLVNSALAGADFTEADLSNADLTGAQLTSTNLTKAQIVGACLQHAQLTGSCIEAWNVDTTTQLEGIACDYVYLLNQQRERRPSYGVFQPGDFARLFQDVLSTVDLIFRQGLDISAFVSAFQDVKARGEEMAISSIENKGDGTVVVRVSVDERANKANIQSALLNSYEQALAQVEARYQAELAAKDDQIALYRQHQSELSKLTQMLTQPNRIESDKDTNPSRSSNDPGKRVVLKLSSPEKSGIPVTLQIGSEGMPSYFETTGWLASAEDVLSIYQYWQVSYQRLYSDATRISAKPAQVTNVSYQEIVTDCQIAGERVSETINNWLSSDTFRSVREAILFSLDPSDSIRFILQTDDQQIRTLPLHVWDFFERYTRAELILSASAYRQSFTGQTSQHQARHQAKALPEASPQGIDHVADRVRVLAIFGDSTGLDVQQDRALLEALPDLSLTCLVEPLRSQLNDSLWEQPWDILFFAGHSDRTGNQQQLKINPTEGITLHELKYGLRQATNCGLKLAIINACDGLQLMRNIGENLPLPPTIAMRHPVPDRVAQAFLKHFLLAFSQGVTLHQAVREARERLQGLESQFPFATWLPVLYQNPASLPFTWSMLKSD